MALTLTLNLPALWKRRAAQVPAERKPSDNPQNRLRVGFGGWWRPVSYDVTLAAKAAMVHPIVARCLNKVASAVAQVQWRVEKIPNAEQTEDDEPARPYTSAEAKAVADWLEYPHPDYTASDLLFWMALNQAAVGKYYYKITRTTQGYTNALYPLPTDKMSIEIERGHIKGYKLQTPIGWDFIPTRQRAQLSDNAATGDYRAFASHVQVPGLELGIEGFTINNVLMSLGIPAQMTEALMRRALETAMGMPNSRYIITGDSLMTREQEDALIADLDDRKTGGDKSGNVLFAMGPKTAVTRLDDDLANIHSKMPLDDMTRLIAGAFGIPIALLGLGAADGAKFASNYSESRLAFWEDTIIPSYLTPIGRSLTSAVCPKGYRIGWSLASIPALQDGRVKRMEALSTVTFLTDDEKRHLCGFPKLKPGQVLPAQTLPKPPKDAP